MTTFTATLHPSKTLIHSYSKELAWLTTHVLEHGGYIFGPIIREFIACEQRTIPVSQPLIWFRKSKDADKFTASLYASTSDYAFTYQVFVSDTFPISAVTYWEDCVYLRKDSITYDGWLEHYTMDLDQVQIIPDVKTEFTRHQLCCGIQQQKYHPIVHEALQ